MSNALHPFRTTACGILIGLILGTASAFAAAPVRKGPVQVELLAQRQEVKPGDTVWLGVKFVMDPEWHLYWVNPGTTGFPPSVIWKPGSGLSVEPVRFPAPKVFKSGGLPSFGYEQELLLLAPARVAPNASGELNVQAKLEWLACDPQTCVPGDAELSLNLRTGSAAGPGRPEFDAAISALPEPSNWKMAAAVNREARLLRLHVEPDREPFPVDSLGFFLEQPGIVDAAATPDFRWEANALAITLPLAKDFSEEVPATLSGLLVARDGSLGRPRLLSTAGGPPAKGAGVETANSNQAAQGTGEGWGSWLQQPLVVAFLAALMFLIGLNLVGVFEVGTGLTGAGGKLGRTEGPAGSFLSGGLATIVATPCTAPFMGSAIFYALGQPPVVTLLIFTFLGAGMAAPYLVLSRFPALIDRLPRPGAWMETLKQGLAFPMFAVVIWLIWVLSFQVDQNGVLSALTGLLLLALAAWWFGRFASPVARKGVRWAARVGPAVLAGLALFLGLHAAEQRLPVKSVDVEQRIQQFQAEGKGVFVDFTAAWCLTCQANKAAMHSGKVKAAFAENRVEFLEVDWTQRDPEVYRTLQKYGRAGVPLYLLFPPTPGGAPQTLPNVLTEGIILDALRNSGRAAAPRERDYGLWGALLGAFLGGLILNLMPCVFPVISLKILGFVKQAGSDPQRIWHHGLAFAAGVLTFFWLLALLLMGAKAGLGA